MNHSNRTTRRYLPAILLGAAFGVASALVLDANAAPALSPSAKAAASAKDLPRSPISELLESKSTQPGVKTYTCPSRLDIGGSSTSFASGELDFTSASVSTSTCSASADFAPASGRGGHCMRCSYENGVTLTRSGGDDTVCWRVPETSNQMACEKVPPVPPSQTCTFEIRPPTVDLMPLSNHLGGDDELYAGGGLGTNFSNASVSAKLERGSGGDSGKLFLTVSATVKETSPDYTLFTDKKRVEIKTSHLAAGTAADIATCLGNFTENRPFETIRGTNGMTATGYERFTLHPIHGEGELKIEARCTFDSPGEDVGEVGCDPITIEPFSITLR